MNHLVDFLLPTWLIVYYYVMGTISIILNSFGIYLLVIQCKNLGRSKYHLLVYQIICFATDIHLTFLMQPIPLYPLLAGYTVGLLSSWFGVPFHYSMLIVATLAILQLDWLVLCFLERHQSVALVLENHRLPKLCVQGFYLFSFIFPLVFGGFFQTLRLDKDEQCSLILTNYPEYVVNFHTLENFAIYRFAQLFYVMCFVTIIGGFFIISSLFIMIVDIFRMMRKLKIRMSKCTYRKHQEALRSLMVQLGAAYFCVFPACFLITVVVLEMTHVQLISELFIVWLAAHSSVNMISLMIFFPPFRRFFRTLRDVLNETTTKVGMPSTF